MIITLLMGAIFGFLLQYAKLNRYNTISGMAILKDYSVAKAIAVAVGVGAILINVEIALDLASYHMKPFMLTGIMAGGLLFGIGMAILGYCPGTMVVSLGEGSIDALLGILGGFAGGILYTILTPEVIELMGPNLGKVSLNSVLPDNRIIFFILVFLIAAVFVGIAFWLNGKEKKTNMKWLYVGIGLAILNAVLFLPGVANRGLGASTLYPYLGDLLSGVTDNSYFEKITKSGDWQIYFMGGAFLAGLIMSLIEKRFKFTLLHDNWKKYKNNSPISRILWAFFAGLIMIFGARMAGGCTSGHVLSGGMQLSFGSLTFGAFVFIGLLVTGRIFYRSN